MFDTKGHVIGESKFKEAVSNVIGQSGQHTSDDRSDATRGRSVRETAAFLRVSKDKVLTWIRAGKLKAINTIDSALAKPRYVVLPQHLDEFVRSRTTSAPVKREPRRKPQAGVVDFYPD